MPKVSHVYLDKANGRYYSVASLGFDKITGKRIQKKSPRFDTQREAKVWYDDFMANHSKAAFSKQSSMSFEKFLTDYYINDYRKKVNVRTFVTFQSKLYRLAFFNSFRLSDIKAVNIKQWHNQMFEESLSNNYIRELHQTLREILDMAVRLGLLSDNQALIAGNVKRQRPRVDFWTKEEFEKFLSTFDLSDNLEYLKFVTCYFLFMTGLRISELQALEWSDLNIDDRSIIINKSMYYRNKQNWQINRTKTIYSTRLIYLDKTTIGVLKEWQSRQKAFGMISFIFSYNSLPITKPMVKRTILSHSERANIKSIRIHDLRHSHASFLLSLGMNDLELQNRLGHANISTTLGTYSHLRPSAMKSVADRLEGSISLELLNREE